MKLELIALGALILVAVAIIAEQYVDNKDCEALGGTTVRTSFSYTCAKLEILK